MFNVTFKGKPLCEIKRYEADFHWLKFMYSVYFLIDMYNVWFQNISITPPQRELEIPKGGRSKTQEIPEGRGLEWSILIS